MSAARAPAAICWRSPTTWRSSRATAERFLDAAEAEFRQLANRPGLGAPVDLDAPVSPGVRCQPISKFRNYLIYYRADDDGIVILRVLHGARDIENLLRGEGAG